MFQKLAILISCMVYVFGNRHHLCSSDTITAWYSYGGDIMDLSFSMSPCVTGRGEYTIKFSVIFLRSFRTIGDSLTVWFRNQKWFEVIHRVKPCDNLKICYLIKGESIQDTLTLYTKPYKPPAGTYLIIGRIFDARDIAQVNVTVEVTK